MQPPCLQKIPRIADKRLVISLSKEYQFSVDDIHEIPMGVGITHFEFDTDVIKACSHLFQYNSNELLAKDLISAKVIPKSAINLSTKNALVIRFKSRKASLAFVQRLNMYLRPCKRYDRQREARRSQNLTAASST